MPIADCRLPNEKQIGLRPERLRERRRAPMGFSLPHINRHSAFGNRHSAFTLIELLVAVGLMAILLTMIAVIFFEATQAFRVARASIQIHESARAAFNALVDDLTAAEFTAYDNGVQGYFALSQGPTDPTTGSYPVPPASTPAPIAANGTTLAADTLTFTTLAPQPGARYAAPEAVQQLALVRYALEFDGGNATVPGSTARRPTFNLVKRVRFPNTGNSTLNMDDFNVNDLQTEVNLSDPNWTQYAQSEPIAFHVLSMNVRLFCLPRKQTQTIKQSEAFVETGLAVGSSGPTLTDLAVPAKTWPAGAFNNFMLRIYTGNDAGDVSANPANPLGMISASGGNSLQCNGAWKTTPNANSQYRVESDLANIFPPATPPPPWPPPTWYQRGNYNFLGTTYRPPAIVEITLEMTDVRATRSFFFTQRFYIPASER